jgi:hypothetical protein
VATDYCFKISGMSNLIFHFYDLPCGSSSFHSWLRHVPVAMHFHYSQINISILWRISPSLFLLLRLAPWIRQAHTNCGRGCCLYPNIHSLFHFNRHLNLGLRKWLCRIKINLQVSFVARCTGQWKTAVLQGFRKNIPKICFLCLLPPFIPSATLMLGNRSDLTDKWARSSWDLKDFGRLSHHTSPVLPTSGYYVGN